MQTKKKFPVVHNKLCWDAINAFPVKNKDMSIEELRQLCVDFFRFTKTINWVADGEVAYPRNSKGWMDKIQDGTVYAGLPYIGLASGNVYRLMDYIDEDGVVDISRAARVLKMFGNQCSIGCYWGWGRVINSADYDWTPRMLQANGFYRVGPYKYDDSLTKVTADYNSVKICEENGEQVMYQSYAQVQPADGFMNFTTAGHVIMCSAKPYVVYRDSGKIDGDNSYITMIDQSQIWLKGSNDSGDEYLYKHNVDTYRSFKKLYEEGYTPFTFAEFMGTHPVEDTVCAFSHTDDTVTLEQLFSAEITCNYGITDAYAHITDKNGKEIYCHAVRAKTANCKELPFVKVCDPEDMEHDNVDSWGELNFTSNEEYTVTVVCQLATGERPTLYTGKLIAEQ